jgi:hypothetical protein
MKYLNIFLSLIVLIILGVFIFMLNTNIIEDFTTDPVLFNIKSFLDDPNKNIKCTKTSFRYPPVGNEAVMTDTVKYIMDSNLVYLPNIKGFTMMYQDTLNELHSKIFLSSESLQNVSLMGCGSINITDYLDGINVFGSDLFLNNLGKRKPQNERPQPEIHRLALNLYEEVESDGTTIKQIPYEKKKMIIVYPDTMIRLVSLYDELNNSSTSTTQATTTQAAPNLTFEQLNSGIIDDKIYNFLYETNFSDTEFKTLLFRILGVEEDLLDKFEIGKTEFKTNPDGTTSTNRYDDLIVNNVKPCNENFGLYDTESGFIEYSDAVLSNNFRFVYYKDVLFSTDLAYWRTSIYNKLVEQSQLVTTNAIATTSSINIPIHISRYSVYSSEDNMMVSFVTLLKGITEFKHQIKILGNMNRYDNLGTEVLIKQNKNKLNEKIGKYNQLVLKYSNDSSLVQSGELIDLSEIITNVINAEYDCSNCETKMTQIDQNGVLIPPNDYSIPEYVSNIYPPYPEATQIVCNTTTSVCTEGFQSNTCDCESYQLSYTFDGRRENMYVLVNGNINIDSYESMYLSNETDRFKLLKLNISLFNPYTPVNAGDKFIEYAQLFHNIPTQLRYIKSQLN